MRQHCKDILNPSTATSILLADKILSALLTILGLAVLGRLLSPYEFGVFGIIVGIQGFFSPVGDLGLGPAYIQKKKIEKYTGNVFFLFNVALGIANALALIIISPFIANFYSEPILTKLMILFSLSIFFDSIGRQPIAYLMREKRFQWLALANLTSRLAGLTTAIFFAYKGFAVWALVLQPVTATLIVTIVALYISKRRYRIPSYQQIKLSYNSIKFGTYLTVSNIMSGAARTVDKLIVGKLFGAPLLGLYNKGSQLALMPDTFIRNPLTSAALPYLCRHDGSFKKCSEIYTAFVNSIVLGPGALSIMIVVMGDFLIVALMGPQWIPAGVHVRLFGMLGLGFILRGTMATIHYRENHMKRWLVFNALSIPFSLGPALICISFGYPLYVFTGAISISTLIFWLLVAISTLNIHLDKTDRISAGWNFLVVFIAIIPSGVFLRKFLEKLNITDNLTSLLLILIILTTIFILLNLWANSKNIKLIFKYAYRKKEA